MSKICFIVLHYGEHNVTEDCVDSILKLKTNHDIQVLIVDNDSHKLRSERFQKKVQYQDARVDVLPLAEPAGFSSANNQGYVYAKNTWQPDFIVMTNNDITFVQEDFCDRIVACYEKSGYAVLGPDILSEATGVHQNPIDTKGRSKWQVNYTIMMNSIFYHFFFLVYPLLNVYNRHVVGKKRKNNTRMQEQYMQDIVPCGACLIFGPEFVNCETKAFAPETEFYYEEYILYERCKRNAYSIVYNADIKVIHGDGVATKKSYRMNRKRMRFVLLHTLESAKIYKQLIK